MRSKGYLRGYKRPVFLWSLHLKNKKTRPQARSFTVLVWSGYSLFSVTRLDFQTLGLSPPTRDVGHPTLMSMDFRWGWPHVWVGGNYEARGETHGMGDLQGMQWDKPQLVHLSPTFPKHPRTCTTHPLRPRKKTLLPHDVNAPTRQLISPPSLPESGHQWPAQTQSWAWATMWEQTWMTHQHTNDGDNDVLGGHCQAASSAWPF